jgi:hypothetical protein
LNIVLRSMELRIKCQSSNKNLSQVVQKIKSNNHKGHKEGAKFAKE